MRVNHSIAQQMNEADDLTTTCRYPRYLCRHPAAQLRLRSLDPLIRDLTHYRDLISQITKETDT